MLEIRERISQIDPAIKIDVEPGGNLQYYERIHANVLSRHFGKYHGMLFLTWNSSHPKSTGTGVGWTVDFSHNPDLEFEGTAVIVKSNRVYPSIYVGTDLDRFCAGWFRYLECYARASVRYNNVRHTTNKAFLTSTFCRGPVARLFSSHL